MTAEPRTEAGKALAEWLRFVGSRFSGVPRVDRILAIEAEAAEPHPDSAPDVFRHANSDERFRATRASGDPFFGSSPAREGLREAVQSFILRWDKGNQDMIYEAVDALRAALSTSPDPALSEGLDVEIIARVLWGDDGEPLPERDQPIWQHAREFAAEYARLSSPNPAREDRPRYVNPADLPESFYRRNPDYRGEPVVESNPAREDRDEYAGITNYPTPGDNETRP